LLENALPADGQHAGADDPIDLDEIDELDVAQIVTTIHTRTEVRQLLLKNGEEVRRAIERLHDGTYGYCEDCSERIDPARLKFKPEATRCVSCQARLERHGHGDSQSTARTRPPL